MSAPTVMMIGVKARMVMMVLIMVYPLFVWVYVGKCGILTRIMRRGTLLLTAAPHLNFEYSKFVV